TFYGNPSIDGFQFASEGQIEKPSSTGLVFDGVVPGHGLYYDMPPPQNLFNPFDPPNRAVNMTVAIPRHGARPSAAPTFWPINRPVPGAINVAMWDVHGDLVKLDEIWHLYLYRGAKPPLKRPGL